MLEIVDGEFRMRLGPIGRRVLAAWRGAVGSAARAGLDVIAEDARRHPIYDAEVEGVSAPMPRLPPCSPAGAHEPPSRRTTSSRQPRA